MVPHTQKVMTENLGVIRRYVEEGAGVSLFSKSRDKEYRFARAVYYALAKKYTKHTLKAIGEEVGRSSHATVKNALKDAFTTAMQYNMYRMLYDNFDGAEITEYDKLYNKYENLKKDHLSTQASYRELKKVYNQMLKSSLIEPHEHRYRALDEPKQEVFKQRVIPILISLEKL